MSGTSLDGIDAVIAQIDHTTPCKLIHALYLPFDDSLKSQLESVIGQKQIDTELICSLDINFSMACAQAVNQLIDSSDVNKNDIQAIGSHGLTIYHSPEPINKKPAFTWQIGDPNTLAELTQLPVVADFRRADIAKGGQGAPLVPPFHAALLQQSTPCIALNIGGIANISVIMNKTIIGFDTGPGNCLMDAWILDNLQQTYDKNGDWAASGTLNQPLLQALLADSYFAKPYPKSTGKEHFNLNWLEEITETCKLDSLRTEQASSIQATLLQLSAHSIVDAIQIVINEKTELQANKLSVFVCGGGAKNTLLMQTLQSLAPSLNWQTTDFIGIDPDWIEACAFAWLAYRRWNHLPSNEPNVTGAHEYVSLGGIYLP